MAAQRTAVTTVAIDRHYFINEADRRLSAFRAGPYAFAAMDALFRGRWLWNVGANAYPAAREM